MIDVQVLLPGRSRRAWLLAATVLMPAAVRAQTVVAQSPPAANTRATRVASNNPAVVVLMQQATYWRGQYQPQQAIDALNRVLRIEPANADALAMLAEIQSEQGRSDEAQASLARLRSVNPSDARQTRIEQALRVGSIDQDALNEARQLARAKRPADAVAAYQRVFKGPTPTESLAVEYYQTMSGAPGAWDQARSGLAQTVEENPQDLRAQLAYAQILTYHDDTRTEGIARLKLLSQNAATADAATTSLKQALVWLPADSQSIPQLQAWLATHPHDADIQSRLNLAENPPPSADDPGGQLRAQGFTALNKGRLNDAGDDFAAALQKNANDADATGGLGLVRMRQGQTAEARTLFQQAIALDPSHRTRWLPMLASGNSSADWARVNSLTAAGNYSGAESLLRRLMVNQRNNVGALLLLGSIETKGGELPDAEATYRRVLELSPDNDSGLLNLANVLTLEKRPAEADELFARAIALGSPLAGQARAAQLQARAALIDNPEGQLGLYRAAVAADPANPWVRLALARILIKLNRSNDAADTMRALNANGTPKGDALQAELIFASEIGNSSDAVRLSALVPAKKRTKDMDALLARVKVNLEIRRAVLSSNRNRDTIREKLLAVAAVPDASGDRGVLVAQTLVRLGDKPGAQLAIENALAENPDPSVDARVAYASALLSAGYPTEAASLISDIDPDAPLTAGQQTEVAGIKNGIAVTASDQLNNAGEAADAFDELAPQLEKTPTDPSLNLALSRLYQGADKPEQALRISLALLARNPDDFDVRRAAAMAAVANSDYQRAQQLAEDGLREAPSAPEAWVLAADVAKSAGDNRRALRDYQVARSLRRQQLGYDDVPARTPAPAAPEPNRSPADDNPADVPRRQPSDLGDTAFDQRKTALGDRSVMPRMEDAQATGLPVDDTPVNDTPVNQAAAVPVNDPLIGTDYDKVRGSAYVNPFENTNPNGNLPDDTALGTNIPNILAVTAVHRTPRSVDTMAQQIQSNIDALQTEVAPTLEMGTNVRDRSGSNGEDALADVGVYISGSFSPFDTGKLTLTATPETLSAGSLVQQTTSPNYFGELPLQFTGSSTTGPTTTVVESQNATGVGFDGKYQVGWATGDIGSTPLGFRQQNIVGGLELQPKLTSNFGFDLLAERRAVTDSVLSYAGTRDPVSGTEWGGVTTNHAHLGVTLTDGGTNFYLGGGYALLRGQTVLPNTEQEAGAGGSTQVAKWSNSSLRMGLDLIYFGYAHNLRYFTLGQGGYFSPKNFFAALVPVTYTSTPSDRLTWSVGGNVGFQAYSEANSNLFPYTPGLQGQVAALFASKASSTVQYYTPYYVGDQKAGIAGMAQASIEYKLTRNLTLGANASIQHFASWNEGKGQLYLRYLFLGDQ